MARGTPDALTRPCRRRQRAAPRPLPGVQQHGRPLAHVPANARLVVALELSADADAAPANVPIRVRVTSHGPSLGWERSAFALIDNRGENRLIDQTDVLWLTVLPLPLAEPDKVVKDGS